MGKKKWKAILDDTYDSIRMYVSKKPNMAAEFAKERMDAQLEKTQEKVSKILNLRHSSAKKLSDEWKRRQMRKCIILLSGLKYGPCTPAQKQMRKAKNEVKKLLEPELQKALDKEWERIYPKQKKKKDRQKADQEKIPTLKKCVKSMKTDLVAFMKKWPVCPKPEIPPGKEHRWKQHEVVTANIVKKIYLGVHQKQVALSLEDVSKSGNNANVELGDIYYLPWGTTCLWKMKIPAKAIGVKSPDIFFTAALSGCSVFVAGPRKSPIVYHAGLDGIVGEPKFTPPRQDLKTEYKKDNAVKLWRTFLFVEQNKVRKVESKKEFRTIPEMMRQVSEVHKEHYVNDQSEAVEDNRLAKTTVHSRAFDEAHKDIDDLELNGKSVPWGCVFGVRDRKGEWSFYLQENIVSYYKKPGDNTLYRAGMPIVLRQFYPKQNHTIVYDATKEKFRKIISAPFKHDGIKVRF